jgi:hypothetical protein
MDEALKRIFDAYRGQVGWRGNSSSERADEAEPSRPEGRVGERARAADARRDAPQCQYKEAAV